MKVDTIADEAFLNKEEKLAYFAYCMFTNSPLKKQLIFSFKDYACI
jgi:hypothetical protein